MEKLEYSIIKSTLTAILVEKLCVEESEVVSEASFINDLGADSLDLVEIMMEIEKEYDIVITEDTASRIITVGDAIDYISKNCKTVIKSTTELKD